MAEEALRALLHDRDVLLCEGHLVGLVRSRSLGVVGDGCDNFRFNIEVRAKVGRPRSAHRLALVGSLSETSGLALGFSARKALIM